MFVESSGSNDLFLLTMKKNFLLLATFSIFNYVKVVFVAKSVNTKTTIADQSDTCDGYIETRSVFLEWISNVVG